MIWFHAALTGLLLALAFPRFDLGEAIFISLVPLMLALQPLGASRREVVRPALAFRLGFLAGVVFFLLLCHWIPRLPRENLTIPYAMVPVLLLMTAYLALYPAVVAMGSAWLARRGVPLPLAFPVLWVLLEAARGTGILGFSWGSLAYALADQPHLIQFTPWTGVWGVSLWVAVVNALVYAALAYPAPRRRILTLGALVALIVAPVIQGRLELNARVPGEEVRVGVIQPNIGNNKWEPSVRDSVVQALLDGTELLAEKSADHPPALVVWPETAIPARLPREAHYRGEVERLVNRTGVPLLAGFPDGWRDEDGESHFTNSAALVIPEEGLVARYDKRHLVPFSEYLPLPILNRFDFGQSSFSPGEDPGLFDQLLVPFGVLICFESIFPGDARELAREGARYLVNITNDQWFGDSAAPYQHFEMNVLRCLELRLGMVRVANTGISGAIDPYGTVTVHTPTFVREYRVVPVELGATGNTTFYARHGNWVLWGLGGVLVILVGLALVRGGRG